jgi:hypothetical protein
MAEHVAGLHSALHAALAAQAAQAVERPGIGIGIGTPSDRPGDNLFVQWCRGYDGDVSFLEVRPPTGNPELEQQLSRRGFSLGDDDYFREHNVWEHVDIRPFSDAAADDDVIAALAELAELLGMRRDDTFEVYP